MKARKEYIKISASAGDSPWSLLIDSLNQGIELTVASSTSVVPVPMRDERPVFGLGREDLEWDGDASVVRLAPTAAQLAMNQVIGSRHLVVIRAVQEGHGGVTASIGGVSVSVPVRVIP